MNRNYKTPGAILTAVVLVLFVAAPLAAGTVKKSGEFYDVKVVAKKQGAKTLATITAKGRSGYKCNMQYPWKLTLKPSPGIKVEKKIYKKKDAKKFAKEAVVFEIAYTQESADKISAKLKLSMCDDKQCKMETVPLTW